MKDNVPFKRDYNKSTIIITSHESTRGCQSIDNLLVISVIHVHE